MQQTFKKAVSYIKNIFSYLNANRKFKLTKQAVLALSALLIFTLSVFYNTQMASSEPAIDYWDNTGAAAINFTALPKTHPSANTTIVSFKQFVADNSTGNTFALLAKYKNGEGNFNAASCTIMIEDAADLYSWSEKCYYKYAGNSNPTLERSVYLSANYILGNNIDYGVTARMIPIGFMGFYDPALRFTGTFDGQGFEISNLQLTYDSTKFIDETSQNCVYYSMFSNIGTGGVVKNLGLIAPYYIEANGVNLSLKFGGIAGCNRGRVEYCFVQSGSNRFSSVNAGEISGVIHSNYGTVDNVYFAGGIYNASNHASTLYNPVVFYNDSNGTISNSYYDSTVFDATVNTAYASVIAKTPSLLQNRTSILQDDKWYTDNYNFNITGYVVGYPRLQGFKYNNAAGNSTTNPYYIARPADLIFFSNAVNAYAAFGNSAARYFRLRSCIDMSGVSAYAYTTPLNNFYANFEGTIDDASKPCVANHVGTGDQLNCHSIINLKLAKPVSKLIGTTQYILMGLVFNDTATAISFKNINFVGGQVVLPSQLESDAYNNYYNIGTFVSFTRYANFTNVHNSADVYTAGQNDYTCKLRMGGLVGGASYTINAQKCSNSGKIDGGTHKYSSTTSNTSAVGGLFGTQENNGGTRQFIDCVNYGEITGITITENTNTAVTGATYVGGIGGNIASNNYTLDRIINYGTINSVKKLPLDATILPINTYYAGGLFGNGPAGASASPVNDTRMCNKGTVYANKTANTTAGAANVAGVSANVSSTYPYKGIGNVGTVVIAKDILSVFAAGITNGAVSLSNCYNDGDIITEDTAALSPTAEVRIFGVSGGSNATSTYYLDHCYNNKNLTFSFNNSSTSVNVRVAGLNYNMRVDNSQNYGNITVSSDSLTGSGSTLTVSGVSDSTTNSTSAVNSGQINVTAHDLSSNLFVAGIVCGNGSAGSLTSCVNTGAIYVKRTNKLNTTANKNTYIAGIKVGRTYTYLDTITDCQNDGEIAYDSYYTDGAVSGSYNQTTNAYIAGIELHGLSANRCVNNGNIILAKTADFTGTNVYIGGLFYSFYTNSNTNIIQNCRNFGAIYNQYNIGTTTNTAGRTFNVNGIVYYGSPNMSRCVNQADITLTSQNTSNNTNFYVNGVMYTTGNIESNRVDYGVTGLSNVGALKMDHSATALPANTKIFMSGIVAVPGTGNTTYVGSLPYKNLVNGGKITALVNTDNAITYSTPGSNSFTAASANVTVAGVSALAAFNSNNASTASIPLRDCANANDITVDLICSAANPSQKINYNVGGIAANSASNTAGLGNQKLNIYDSVNGGNITVNTINNTSTSSLISGVGGILGFGYQYTNGVTSATESNVNSSIYNCINYGTIKGGYSTGGIVGCDGAVIKNVMNFGSVIATNNGSAGGVVGAIRSALKGNNTRMIYAIDGAINYGSISADTSATPVAMGAIIGNLAVGQDSTYGNRRYAKIINAATYKFIGTMVAQSTNNTFESGTLVDVATATFNPATDETSDAFFKNNITNKTDGPVTDSSSIYFKDTNTDTNSFFFRVGEDLPENNSWFVYLDPSQSKRNTYNAQTGTYSPYPNGIYALSTFDGKKSGYYPSSNVILPNCDPILISGQGYTNWRNNIIGTNTETIVSKMDSYRQIKLNTGNDIISLQLTSGGGTPILLRNGQLDAENSKVIYYVVKDNFNPAIYTPDIYSTNTVLSDKATFDGATSLDMSSGFTFATAQKYTFTLTVRAEDGNTKPWTIEVNSIAETAPLILTSIKEGVNIANSAVSPASHTYTSSNAYNYTLDGTVSSVHNNTLIFNFNTAGLLPGKNMITDVSMQTSTGTVVTPGSTSTSIGSANTTYYKVLPNGSYGVDSYNYKVIGNDYVNYAGTLTVNIRLHSNLGSGSYKILINTVYGTYTFNFTRELCTEAEVQSNPSVLLISGGTVPSTVSSATGIITTNNIIYGNAPDISKINTTNGVFSTKPTISKNATMTPLTFIGSTINADGSRLYTFTFSITSESGVTKNWELRVPTSAYNTSPAKIEVDYSGTTYFGAQVTDPAIMNEIFAMNKNQSGSYMVRYDVSAGNTGNNALYNILNNTNYTYELYRNNILIPESEYASYGITIAKQSILGNYLRISIDAAVNVPSGAYELRTYYYRPTAAISPTVTDASNNSYSEFTWTEKVQYPSFYFFKAVGKKLSYAVGLTVPYVPDTYSVLSGATPIYWDGTNFDYSILGENITSEEHASYTHRQFNIEFKYKTDTFYYNFKPIFTLPDGATLYRERSTNNWEQVTSTNLSADFSGGKSIRYRVYAEDTRFYNDYVITLQQVTKSKQFNVNFQFQNGAPNTIPVSATLKSVGMETGGNYLVFGNTTVFSHPNTTFALNMLPPGSYIFDVIVPAGYRATIVADNSPTANDIAINGKLLSGNWKMVTAMNDIAQNFNITVNIEPIPNYSPPWGIERRTGGN